MSGYRGRGFGPRGIHPNGPANICPGPRFPHPSFNPRRPPHNRLPGTPPLPWKPNGSFRHPMRYRGDIRYWQNGRGRATNGWGHVPFLGPNRPPAPPFSTDFARNFRGPRPLLAQEVQIDDKSGASSQTPLLGSEEERQQKITETADKLKQKLSSITEEELTHFWEDDFSVPANNENEEEIVQNNAIPELRHYPPELDLTFTDFRDIGRVDPNNSKLDNLENAVSTDDVVITFAGNTAGGSQSTNLEVSIFSENREESGTTAQSLTLNEISNSPIILFNDDDQEDQERTSASHPNLERPTAQSHDARESFLSERPNDVDGTASATSTQPTDVPSQEKSRNWNEMENAVVSLDVSQDQNASRMGSSENQPSPTADVQLVVQESSHGAQHIQIKERNNLNSKAYQPATNLPVASEGNSFNLPVPREEPETNMVVNPQLPLCPTYKPFKPDEIMRPDFPPQMFNGARPRFLPRIPGPRCRRPFLPNGANMFLRGQRPESIRGCRMSLPRHNVPFHPDFMPVPFDPRAPPPFTKVSTPNLDSHDALLPFPTNQLPASFDPSEPPPNVRPLSVHSESSGEKISPCVSPFDLRPQLANIAANNAEILQAPGFNRRGQPLAMTSSKENPLQPPPAFDPRLSPAERSNLIGQSTSEVCGTNLLQSMIVPPPQTFFPNRQMIFPPVLQHPGAIPGVAPEFQLPLPSFVNLTEALPPRKDPSSEKGTADQQQALNLDDGLVDMQNAMEFAKKVKNLTGESGKDQASVESVESILLPSEIPVPSESVGVSHTPSREQLKSEMQKSRRKEGSSKKIEEKVCGVTSKRPEGTKHNLSEDSATESQLQSNRNVPLANNEIRPKVMFNLNSKSKKINQTEDWNVEKTESRSRKHDVPLQHDISLQTAEPKRSSASVVSSPGHREKPQTRRHHDDKKPVHRDKSDPVKEKKSTEKKATTSRSRSSTDKLPVRSSDLRTTDNTSVEKKSKRPAKAAVAPTLESSWKNRVINRFLRMSKNDICNMVNNSSLRKFDIAMKHLVKERRSSLSLEMRNTEDEKMKEYDREEFMSQLNAMLDPGAVVGITDLPTEFIHHLSEVLQLDPMPTDPNYQELDGETGEVEIESQTNFSEIQILPELTPEVVSDARPPEENLPRKPAPRNVHLEADAAPQKQPLFNVADLDDILSEVTERRKDPKPLLQEPRKSSKTRKIVPSVETKTNLPNYKNVSPLQNYKNVSPLQSYKNVSPLQSYKNVSPLQSYKNVSIPNQTVTDVDDIFSSGIARANRKSKSADAERSRARKSLSADRSTLKAEKCGRWNRKHREDPDAFRNLTKEEWEAKYGPMSDAMSSSNVMQTSGFNSSDNLSRACRSSQFQRYRSSESPVRQSTSAPRETSLDDAERSLDDYSFPAGHQLEKMTDSSSSSSTDDAVAPDVTKLLRVIKEKEKIAKQKSLNQTIRDEVAAEIEKRWKKKSERKERKSRRWNRKNRGRHCKRAKGRRRNLSESDSEKSSGEHPLLAADDIKKETTVKEEPEELSEIRNTSGNETTFAAFLSATGGQVVEEVPVRQEKSASSQTANELVPLSTDVQKQQAEERNNVKTLQVFSSTMQRKTKAQLKQMPESSNMERREVSESLSEAAVNVGNEKIPTNNNSLRQSDVPLHFPESATNEATNETNRRTESLNLAADTAIVNRQGDDRLNAASTLPGPTESKKECKKIDIKAYKERALQRRLKEQGKLPEYLEKNSLPSSNSQQVAAVNKVAEEPALDARNSGQSKNEEKEDSQSAGRIKAAENSSLEISSKENERETTLEVAGGAEKVQEISSTVQSKNSDDLTKCREKSSGQLVDPLPNIPGLSEQLDDVKINNNKSLCSLNPVNKLALDETTRREKSKTAGNFEEKTLGKPELPVDAKKFKNIRSEGGKEMKLKKEAARTSKETKKKSIKILEVKDLKNRKIRTEKHFPAVEPSADKTPEVKQRSVQPDVQKIKVSEREMILPAGEPSPDLQQPTSVPNIANCDPENSIVDSSTENCPLASQNYSQKEKSQIQHETNPEGDQSSSDLKDGGNDPKLNEKATSDETEANDRKVTEKATSEEETEVDNVLQLTSLEEKEIPTGTEEETDRNSTDNSTSNQKSEADSINCIAPINDNATTIRNMEINPDVEETDENSRNCRLEKEIPDFISDEARSPLGDSLDSPFKGFSTESTQEGITGAPDLLNSKIDKEEDQEDGQKKYFGAVEEISSNGKDAEEKIAKETDTEAEGIPVENLTPVCKIFSVPENVDKIVESRGEQCTAEEEPSSSIIKANTQDTLENKGKACIVSEKCLHNKGKKSVSQLGSVELDIDDCSARDANTFSVETLSIDRAERETELASFNFVQCQKQTSAKENVNKLTPITVIQNDVNSTVANEEELGTDVQSTDMQRSPPCAEDLKPTDASASKILPGASEISRPDKQDTLSTKPAQTKKKKTDCEETNHQTSTNKSTATESSKKATVPATKGALKKPIDSCVDRSEELSESPKKSTQKEKNGMLHKIKDKVKMGHKQEKKRNVPKAKLQEMAKSDIVRTVVPNTKKGIMARMIEIDVEIHKLMTEKMTLYELLHNNPGQFDVSEPSTGIQETKEVETLIRRRTPSILVSQLIQNIEASPAVAGQSTKESTEPSPVKDSAVDPQQFSKHKTASKQQHKRNASFSTADDEEANHPVENTKLPDSKRSKKQKSERAIKSEDGTVSTNILPDPPVEKKHANDVSKSKSVAKQASNDLAREVVPSIKNDKRTLLNSSKQSAVRPSSKTSKKTSEVPDHCDKTSNESFSTAEKKEPKLETSTHKAEGANKTQRKTTDDEMVNSVATFSENAADNLLIYSDDSTRDSFPQPETDANVPAKPSTGLALLEKSYRKEMARSRKSKVEARKRKKKELQHLLKTVNALTTTEEELPLTSLYIAKLQQKKSLLESLDSKVEESSGASDPSVWQNVDKVINAVAENRVECLYAEDESDVTNRDAEVKAPQELPTTLLQQVEVHSEPETVSQQPPSQTFEVKNKNVKEAKDAIDSASERFATEAQPNDVSRQEILVDNVESSSAQNIAEATVREPSDVAESSATNLDRQGTVNNGSDRTLNGQTIEEGEVGENSRKTVSLHGDQDNSIERPENETVSCDSNIVFENTPENSVSMCSAKTNENRCDNLNTEDEIGGNNVTKRSNSKATNVDTVELRVSTERNVSEKLPLEPESHVQKITVDVQPAQSADESEKSGSVKIVSREKTDNSNQSGEIDSTPSVMESSCASKTGDSLNKKSVKRKRSSSRTPVRKSSRYSEETAKRGRLEPDANTQNGELEEKTFPVSIPLSSIEEVDSTTSTNVRRNRSSQRHQNSRKRVAPLESEISGNRSIATSQTEPSGEFVKQKHDASRAKKRDPHTLLQMMNCKVRLVDSKHTILKPNVSPNLLKRLGISRINSYLRPTSPPVNSSVNNLHPATEKDLPNSEATQEILVADTVKNQTPEFAKPIDDIAQSSSDQSGSTKIQKPEKHQKITDLVTEDENCTRPESESSDPPVVVTKENDTADAPQNCGKPDIEIVEETTSLSKTQHYDDVDPAVSVIEVQEDKEVQRTQYTVHKGPILDIKVFEKSFLAASEDGRVYRYNQASNGILNIYKGHKSAVTCLYVHTTGLADFNKEWMFSGSLDGTLRCYNIMTGVQIRDTVDIGSPIQCMDQAWGVIFVGTKSGHVSRYHIKSGNVKGDSIQFSDKSVLALKATNEGPRRVLIVASRNQPIMIRDAQTGLFLRTVCSHRNHTVYSLMRDNHLIYCGTSSTSILVFDFTNGDETRRYDAGVGIVCMRLYKRLLFAGCYDGNIYIFDTKDHRLICSIPGPGNMLLSMEIIDNKIVAGSKDKRLQSWQMPKQVQILLRKPT